jgi:hypothetical protein
VATKSRPVRKVSNNSNDSSKYGRKGAKARAAWLEIPEKAYDPNTKAYCDALWMRVHEEDCPMLLLKDKKKVITLEQADKEGWRIGESGQSGRDRCCFKGYRRKYPEKEFTDDTPGITQIMKSGKLKWHQAGCHRFTISPEHVPMTMGEAMAKTDMDPYVCVHCIERGPNLTTADLEKLKARPVHPSSHPLRAGRRKPSPPIRCLRNRRLTFSSRRRWPRISASRKRPMSIPWRPWKNSWVGGFSSRELAELLPGLPGHRR